MTTIRKPPPWLTQARLRQILHYNPNTGVWTWRVDYVRRKAGTDARHECNGYWQIHLMGHHYQCSRLAFLYMTGRWPEELMDHINHDPSDDRWWNLREAKHVENMRNKKLAKNNTSGFKGVQRENKKWRAQIRACGRTIRLGSFDTPEEAHSAYRAAALKYYGEFASY